MKRIYIRRGRHYRRGQKAASIRRLLCRLLDNFTARVAGRHSRLLMRLRVRLNRG